MTATYTIGSGSTVATPTASPSGGTYSSSQSVTLSDTTSGAVICYTTDETTPASGPSGTCSNGAAYSGPISVAATTTVEAIGTLAGETDSSVMTDTYTIAYANTVAIPTASPAGGTYSSSQNVTLSDATSGATICYTTDGSAPAAATPGTCSNGTTYSGPISLAANTTLEAIGTLAGDNNSFMMTDVYTIGGSTVAVPMANPPAGTYSSSQSVTLSDATNGAAICYTTDGSTPTATTPGTCSHGTTYSSSINVAASTTITAIGTIATGTNSPVMTGAYTIGSSGATIILCPNNGEVGNFAACAPSPTLAFGNQGTGTASMAIPISVNNCSTSTVAACTGSGSATLDGSPFSISGTNSGDFTVSNGTCSPSQMLATGEYCEPTITFTPTAAAGTNETATLTVSDTGATTGSQTMTLTGTSATVTNISSSSCPSSLTSGNYQLTANISCAGTAFEFSSGGTVDVNLNGHTVTYGTANQPTQMLNIKNDDGTCTEKTVPVQIGGFLNAAYNTIINIHNGTIAHGSGTTAESADGVSYPLGDNAIQARSSIIGDTNTLTWDCSTGSQTGANYQYGNVQVSNLTANYDYEYGNVVEDNGGNATIHDVTINSTGVGNCDGPGCRGALESASIYQTSATGLAPGGTSYYNITQNGGPQGGLAADAPGAAISYNYLNPGNASGTNTQEFGIFAWSKNASVHHNLLLIPITSSSDERGISVDDVENSGPGRTIYGNYIGAASLPNNTEYLHDSFWEDACEEGGSYSIQFDDISGNPSNTASGNMAVATVVPPIAIIGGTSESCAASALRVTASPTPNSLSTGNTYTAIRESGAEDCETLGQQNQGIWGSHDTGCAYAASFMGTTGFTSIGDTFKGDSADIDISDDGGQGITIQSPTFLKGSNPSDFHTFVAQNGPLDQGTPEPASVHIVDATFGPGTSSTDTEFSSQSNFGGPASFYIDWTQTTTVKNSEGSQLAGATVKFTDALSNTYTCTTNSNGQCSVAVTQQRDNNDTQVNGVESRNPFSLSVTSSGCTTYNQTGLTISATTNRNITLSGC